MSEKHLADLEAAIDRSGWLVVAKDTVQDHHISARWQLRRKWNDAKLMLEFLGADDLETLPVEKSYACIVLGHPNADCYFVRESRTWPAELANFEAYLSAFP